MIRTLIRLRGLRPAAALAAMLMLAAPQSLSESASADASRVEAITTESAALDVRGAGPDPDKVACVVCSAAVLLAGGSSILGLITLAFVLPEAVGVCVAVCIRAYA